MVPVPDGRTELDRNLRVTLEYDGTDYSGFQIQPKARTVQGELERALQRLTRCAIRVQGAGRTDAGAHATGQVVSFRTDCSIPDDRLPAGLNRLLPQDMVVVDAERVADSFHARYSAKAKVYEYRLIRGGARAPVRGRFAHHVRPWPDVGRMGEATQSLVGTHDFAAFAASGGKAEDTVRTLTQIAVSEDERGAVFRIEGDGFLYKMVRNIVGTALEVGIGTRPMEDMVRILERGDRRLAGATAPAKGLCLVQVRY